MLQTTDCDGPAQTFRSTSSPCRRRLGERRPILVRARLTWTDDRGALRLTSVVIANATEFDLFAECRDAAAIPLHRLVHVQVERDEPNAANLPACLKQHRRVMAAVYRVGPHKRTTGTPVGYALRLIVEPAAAIDERPQAVANY